MAAIVAILFAGCKKDDNATPDVTLIGGSDTIISLNAPYTDPGATASDAEDGTLLPTSDESAANPDVNNAGVYYVKWTVTDADGNSASATRTITVRNDAYELAGSYNTTEGGGTPWTQTISLSTTQNNVIKFSKFANYQNNTGIVAVVTSLGSDKYVQITPSPQQANGIGATACDHSFSGDGFGNKLTASGSGFTFSIKFTDQITGGGGSCTPTGALPFEDVFIPN